MWSYMRTSQKLKKKQIAISYTLTSCIYQSSSRGSNGSFFAPYKPVSFRKNGAPSKSNSAVWSGVVDKLPSNCGTGGHRRGAGGGAGDDRSSLTIPDYRYGSHGHVFPADQQRRPLLRRWKQLQWLQLPSNLLLLLLLLLWGTRYNRVWVCTGQTGANRYAFVCVDQRFGEELRANIDGRWSVSCWADEVLRWMSLWADGEMLRLARGGCGHSAWGVINRIRDEIL